MRVSSIEYRASPSCRLAALTATLLCVNAWAARPPGSEARRLVKAAGVQGGLVVHLGCGDGRLTAGLRAGEAFVVHGLDTDAGNVAKARSHLRALGLCGPVSVEAFDGEHLPYADNLVNLIVAETLGSVPMAEVMRVLAPRGVAMIGGHRTVKPWPDDIDEWTHFLHGPDNNALAEDRAVGPPRHMQWLAGPPWTRHHHADKGTNPTIRAVVSARGRLFYMVDEAGTSDMKVPSRWKLAARDAFSGVLLWKRPIEVNGSARRLALVWRTLIADGDEIYAPLAPDQPLRALDAATGAVLRTYPGTEALREAVKGGNTLFVLCRQHTLLALRADTGQRLWQWEPPDGEAIVRVTLAAADGRVFLRTERSALCLSAHDGEPLWRTPLEGPEKKARLRYPRERLIVSDGVVLCSHGGTNPKLLNRDRYEYLGSHPRVRAYQGKLAALSADDGRVLWRCPYRPGLESMPGELYASDGTVWLGPDFARPRDLHTGAVERTRPVIERLWTDGHHYRCYPGKATSRYVITAKRGIEMIDLTGTTHARHNWVRGTCRVGVTPCNGLI
ncbi:MAG: PQQ-binding-like beta-propeller repeat protein, partial [Planctomycetota bacterium]